MRQTTVSGAREVTEASHVLLVSPLSDSELLELLHLLESHHGARRIATVRPIPSWVREQHPACRASSLEGSSHLELVQVLDPPSGGLLFLYQMTSCGTARGYDTARDAPDQKRRQERREALDKALEWEQGGPGTSRSSSGRDSSVLKPKSWKELLRVVFFSLACTVGILCFLLALAMAFDGLLDISITTNIDPRFLAQCALASLTVLAMVAVVDEGIYLAPTSAKMPSPNALLFQTAAMASVLLGLLLMVTFANNSMGAALTMA